MTKPEFSHSADHGGTDVPLTVELLNEVDRCIVVVSGHLLVGHSWQVRELGVDVTGTSVTIDMTDVSRLDAAGVAAVSSLARRILADAGNVDVIYPIEEEPRRMIEMTAVIPLIKRQHPTIRT